VILAVSRRAPSGVAAGAAVRDGEEYDWDRSLEANWAKTNLRDFYRHCVRGILASDGETEISIRYRPAPRNDGVDRCVGQQPRKNPNLYRYVPKPIDLDCDWIDLMRCLFRLRRWHN
jgi:hypothetical protein